ncbi:MAG: hypothetical protein JOZ73_04855 [Solirubrobacterales bacterium]|nr:hypothetical protein [Solirubrobacterales bacterium]
MRFIKHLSRRRLTVFAGTLLATAGLVASSAGAALAAPKFPECPPVGNNQGCSQLIVIRKDGTAVVKVDPAAPKFGYDGYEDTLIGVKNRSKKAVSSINLASPFANIMGFDGDGICNPAGSPLMGSPHWIQNPGSGAYINGPTPPGCPGPQGFGSTGYEGPGTSYSNISSNKRTGTVSFSPALQPGSSAYFALEEALQAGQLRSSQSGPVAGPITVKRNFVSFDLTCVGKKPCNGVVQLVVLQNGNTVRAASARKKGKKISLGRFKINIAVGSTGSVLITLNGKGRKLHKKHKHLTATIVVKIGGKTYKIGKVKFK